VAKAQAVTEQFWTFRVSMVATTWGGAQE
jgi:hypothetical protein